MENTNRPALAIAIHRLDMCIGRKLMSDTPAFSRNDVSGPNGRIIHFLADHENEVICQKDLESEFGITRSTASHVLNLMEQKGLIRRQSVAGDARLKQVLLTERARQLSTDMTDTFQAMEARLISGFSEDELERLGEWLARMEQNLNLQGSDTEK